ncbi:hypothetical protein LTR99_006138 [Exophiala xenobiotica]|uniref:GST N-terminal domain-containing protein n=1 Tax=Vermiconidia calcicola TaxID=1690605 RepID=A0AAV9QEY4_9PEZI|nr:hypothetical protein LTR92_011289 [Exophiala xenobiotica]KAK5533130.1 hypothetical protein LTR23_009332 [Chaetothyriales sp. CCFEE 6169]KAK5540790.1 hypothetical protein LTR25_002567 [Vermiconidia calcicola]KAK5236711.1 hypothetical protein LTR47_001889 [Exophiala xenobiotica]KAK5251035.1 hypothetical protein LTS06_004185 [Exophiala xenobiotica]
MSSTMTKQDGSESDQYPKIKMYTNHGCGWCHRVHITLKELGLAYEEVFVDLDNPRPDWFLELNPRGLVPVFQYTATPSSATLTLTESNHIVAFLTDLYPSHLTPAITTSLSPSTSPSPDADNMAIAKAHLRYRMSFFIDTFFSKVNPYMFRLVGADSPQTQAKLVDECIALLEKEIEPLLADANPYFGGSDRITVVEVSFKLKTIEEFNYFALKSPASLTPLENLFTHSLNYQAMTTPFTLRLHDFADGQIFPTSLAQRMTDSVKLPNFARWLDLCMAHPSVTYVWDKEYYLPRIVERLPQAKAKYASK